MPTNTTVNTATGTYLNKTFYDRKLLETAKTRFVFSNFGQKRSIPKHNGKRVEFRKYNLFTPSVGNLTLQEGITPDGQSLGQSKVEATVAQYGAYVEVSDLLDMTAYDEVISDSAELLGEQLGTVIEWVTRDAVSNGTNVQYVGGKTYTDQLESGDVLTVEEIRKAVRTLKKNKARMFHAAADGSARKPHFICICSPDATYDLQNDPLWQDVSKYSNAEQIYSGEIGRLFGVVFVESTEARVKAQTIHIRLASAVNNSNKITFTRVLSADEIAFFKETGNEVIINGETCMISGISSTANNVHTLTLDTYITADAGTVMYSLDGGKVDEETFQAPDVHCTLVFGADAYGVIDVDGSGTMETIIKPHGSAGSLDPLNQRATVGAKVAAYAAKILNNLWLVRIEHTVSE